MIATALAVLALLGTAAEKDVAAWAAAYEAATLAGPGVDAAGRTLQWDHLELSLTSGRLYPVIVGGEVAGTYFLGQGRFRYSSTDPVEAAVYRDNVRQASDYEVAADGGIGDGVSEALVMLSHGADTLAGEEGWPRDGQAPDEAVRRLAAHVERWREDMVLHYRQLLTQARFDPSAHPVVLAEITASKHDLFYGSDPLRHAMEWLAVMRPGKASLGYGWVLDYLGDRRVQWSLSSRPLEREWLASRPAPYVMTTLDATVVNPEGTRAEVETRQTFVARQPLRVLPLRLASWFVGNALATSKKALLDYRLLSVADESGTKLPFVHDQGDLLVQLPAVLEPEHSVVLTFVMEGDVLHRPGGDRYWGLDGGWYPSPAHEAMRSFSYHAVVKAPGDFRAFSTGDTVRRWEEGPLACAEFRQQGPIGYAVVLAGKYTTETEERDGLTVHVSTYGLSKKGASKQIAGLTHAFVKFFEPLLGPFPFRELDVIEINAYGMGQAPPGVIFITKEAFNPYGSEYSQRFIKGINQRLAHEVAHAWWGHVARDAAPEDQWLSESVAEYYSALAMQMKGEDEFGNALQDWQTQAGRSAERGSLYLANYVSGKDAWEQRTALLYARGPLVLQALREELGDQTFFTLFKSLLRSFPKQPVATRDVLGLLGFISKRDYRPWFDSYVFGTEPPPPPRKP